jgi:hypothetical protein
MVIFLQHTLFRFITLSVVYEFEHRKTKKMVIKSKVYMGGANFYNTGYSRSVT